MAWCLTILNVEVGVVLQKMQRSLMVLRVVVWLLVLVRPLGTVVVPAAMVIVVMIAMIAIII